MWISSLNQLRNILKIPSGEDGLIKKFSIDSRAVSEGDLFCALPGEKVNGAVFIEEAFKKGACCALVSKNEMGFLKANQNVIYVENVLETLQNLGKFVFDTHRPMHVIGVTGSLGKTTTKEFIAALASESYSIFKTPGNANSQVGLPLAILNYFNHQQVAVLEMGMTKAGQISSLVAIAPPDIAMITKVGLVHSENFSSLLEIQEAKTEIFLHPKTKIGIYPREIFIQKGELEKLTFSLEDENADFFLEKKLFSKKPGWRFKSKQTDFHFENLPFQEPHLLHNLLGSLAVIHELNIDFNSILRQFDKLVIPEKRMQKKEKKGVLFIDDAYNAAPDSVIAALKSLPKPASGKKRIAVLGAMQELGKFSDEAHRRVGQEALLHVDHMICFGKPCASLIEVWKEAGKPFAHLDNHAAIGNYLQKLAEPGDVVLLKGSNSTKMWTIMDIFT